MSNAIYPTTVRFSPKVRKSPEFSTIIQSAASKRETRASLTAYPIWNFSVSYELLRQYGSYDELRTIAGFFLQRRGAFDSFLFTDPSDNSVTDEQFGVCNGVTTQFQLTRAFGGFVEPCENINSITEIYLDLWGIKQTVSSTSRANFLEYSAAFDNPAWIKNNCSVTANAALAPDGTNTADKVTTTTSTDPHIYQTRALVSPVASRTFTFSIWLWTDSGQLTDSELFITDNITFFSTVITLTTTPVRHEFTATFSASLATNVFVRFDLPSASPVGGFIYAWGAQLEERSTASAYIPSTATPVTIAADYSLTSTGVVTFASAPTSGDIKWSGTYYMRCRFVDDAADFESFSLNLYELKRVDLIGAPGNKV